MANNLAVSFDLNGYTYQATEQANGALEITCNGVRTGSLAVVTKALAVLASRKRLDKLGFTANVIAVKRYNANAVPHAPAFHGFEEPDRSSGDRGDEICQDCETVPGPGGCAVHDDDRRALVATLRDAFIDASIAAGRRAAGGPVTGQPPQVHALVEAIANYVQNDLHDSAELIRDMLARAIRFDQTATKLADFAAAAEPQRGWCDEAGAVVSNADACGNCAACVPGSEQAPCEDCDGPLSEHVAGGLVCTNHACFLGNGQAAVQQ